MMQTMRGTTAGMTMTVMIMDLIMADGLTTTQMITLMRVILMEMAGLHGQLGNLKCKEVELMRWGAQGGRETGDDSAGREGGCVAL
jgi:hypothetical protein